MYYKDALNERKSNPKKLWKFINSIISNKRANNQVLKKTDSTVNDIDFEEPGDISKQFNRYFVENGQKITSNTNSTSSNHDLFQNLSKKRSEFYSSLRPASTF